MPADAPSHVVPVDALRDLVGRMFAASGCSVEEAERVARFLVSANLAGHDSHGVIRVPRYIEWLRDGLVFAGKSNSIVTETRLTRSWTAMSALGRLSGCRRSISASARRGRRGWR